MNDTSEMDSHARLVAALQQARENPPWTERIVTDSLEDPETMKQTASTCLECPEPCETGEVCATLLAKEEGLLAEVGKEQAFAHVESGIERLEITETVCVRNEDGIRPNTFISKK